MAALSVIGLAGCDGSDENSAERLNCSDVSIPTVARPGVRRPTPRPAASLDVLYGLLERYESTSFSASYVFCSDTERGEIQGTARWYKDALTRARMDATISVEGRQSSVTAIATTDGFARAALCSVDIGGYFRTLLGSQLIEASEDLPEVKGLLSLTSACIDTELDDDGALATADEVSLSPPLLANIRSAPDIYAYDAIVYGERSGRAEGHCIRLGGSYNLQEFCFREDGVLISAESQGDSWRSRYTLVAGSVRTVTDADFEPPYEVLSSPEECPYQTPWERASHGGAPADPMAIPRDQLVLEYRDTLVRYFRSSYTAQYHLCYREFEFGSFDGSLVWYKDGFSRARYDLVSANEDRSVSYFATRDGPTFWCSTNLGKEIGRQVIGSDREDILVVQELLDVQAGCVEDSEDYRSCVCFGLDDDFLGRLFFFDPLTHNVAAVETGAGEGLRIPGLHRESRTIAGLEATCFVRPSGEECYGPSGELLLVRTGANRLEAENVAPAPAETEFALPFEIKPGLPQRSE
ncbi:MAG: hypothetical protein WEC75_06695 [Dehalococcoidia bacterium]